VIKKEPTRLPTRAVSKTKSEPARYTHHSTSFILHQIPVPVVVSILSVPFYCYALFVKKLSFCPIISLVRLTNKPRSSSLLRCPQMTELEVQVMEREEMELIQRLQVTTRHYQHVTWLRVLCVCLSCPLKNET
jgi:hypothetical protein